MNERIVNFSAGPAAMIESVLRDAQSDLINYKGTGLSVMEMSHRSKEFTQIHDTALANFRHLLAIPDNYRVLFLQGGASHQFAMIPMNIAQPNAPVDVIHTGSWTKKAIGELKQGYEYAVVASNEAANHLVLPALDAASFNPNASYVYMCSNNTIFGTQWASFPKTTAPLVVDMSSDILSRPICVEDMGIIFAGAQKNIGPAGLTVVVIRDDLLDRCPDSIPHFFNYTNHVTANSLYNTPPTFAIYMANLVFEYLIEHGGLVAQEKRNQEKAHRLYEAINQSPLFYCPVPESDRSKMNVVFRHVDHDESVESAFINAASRAGFSGLKGHRSVGGLRASIYNAQPLENIERFCDFLHTY